jgi:hypothetical protein
VRLERRRDRAPAAGTVVAPVAPHHPGGHRDPDRSDPGPGRVRSRSSRSREPQVGPFSRRSAAHLGRPPADGVDQHRTGWWTRRRSSSARAGVPTESAACTESSVSWSCRGWPHPG